jgi:hypothetical protein
MGTAGVGRQKGDVYQMKVYQVEYWSGSIPYYCRRKEFLSNAPIFSSAELAMRFCERVRKSRGLVFTMRSAELEDKDHADWVSIWDSVANGGAFPPIDRCMEVLNGK